jgi:hypothetical protein
MARLALVVVLPTPPFPEVTTMISAKTHLPEVHISESIQDRKLKFVVFQPDLH